MRTPAEREADDRTASANQKTLADFKAAMQKIDADWKAALQKAANLTINNERVVATQMAFAERAAATRRAMVDDARALAECEAVNQKAFAAEREAAEREAAAERAAVEKAAAEKVEAEKVAANRAAAKRVAASGLRFSTFLLWLGAALFWGVAVVFIVFSASLILRSVRFKRHRP